MFAYYLLVLIMTISQIIMAGHEEYSPESTITRTDSTDSIETIAAHHNQMLHNDEFEHPATEPGTPRSRQNSIDSLDEDHDQTPTKKPTVSTQQIEENFKALAKAKFREKSTTRHQKYLDKVNTLSPEDQAVFKNPDLLSNMNKKELVGLQTRIINRIEVEDDFSRLGGKRSQTFIDDLTKLKNQIIEELKTPGKSIDNDQQSLPRDIAPKTPSEIPALPKKVTTFFDLINTLSPQAKAIYEHPEKIETMSLEDLDKFQQEITRKIKDEETKNGIFRDTSNNLFLKALTKLETAIESQKTTVAEAQGRATQRDNAQAGTLGDYLANNVFTKTNNKETFNINDVHDEKITVLNKQIEELEQKEVQTPAIKAEIADLQQQKQAHYKNLYAEIKKQVDTLESEQRKWNTASRNMDANKVTRSRLIKELDTNQKTIGELTTRIQDQERALTEQKQEVQTLQSQRDTTAKDINQYTEELTKLQREPKNYVDPETTTRIKEITTQREKLGEQLTDLNRQITEAQSSTLSKLRNKFKLPDLETQQTKLQDQVNSLGTQLRTLHEAAKPTFSPDVTRNIQELQTRKDLLIKQQETRNARIEQATRDIQGDQQDLDENRQALQTARNQIKADTATLAALPQPTPAELNARIQKELDDDPNASAQERKEIRQRIEKFPLVTSAELQARDSIIQMKLNRLNAIRHPLEQASLPTAQP